jgi:3-hydroxyisobutyrate dehydrogenase
MKTIGVIGLGNMGRGMALSLQRAGFDVLGFDVSAEAMKRASADAIATASSIADLSSRSDAIVLSLPNSAIVDKVLMGEGGVVKAAREGTLVIDTSTSDPEETRRLAKLMPQFKLRLIDAPVSGGAKGALNGELTMFIGGSEADVEYAKPVLAAMGKNRFHIGDMGAGNVAKIINNLLCASHLLIAGEALRLASVAGVEPARLLDGINAGSGRSAVTQNNIPNRVLNNAYDSGFTMELMRKDVRLAVSLAEQMKMQLPVTSMVGEVWSASAAKIDGKEDYNRIVNFQK